MNDDQDPMLGDEDTRKQYLQNINDMIAQDVEQRRAQRMAEFQNSRESKAVIIGMTGVGDGLIGALGDTGS